ncbi:MAG: orotate phosphoribosyltransferase [Longimicrobiales bacterium]
MNRRLGITYRHVSAGLVSEYDAAWRHVADMASAAGARVWRYQAIDRADTFIEFIEWQPGPDGDPVALPDAIEHLHTDLGSFGPGESGVWADASPPPSPAESRARLLELIRERSLRHGDFVLSSGAHASYYIDARVTTMSGEGQTLIGAAALDAFERLAWKPRCVGGLTLGADPIAYAIAHTAARRGLAIDAFSVRKQPKQHGTARRIEGAFSADSDVVVIEDVITSGESALQAIAAVRESNARILGVFALVDRMEGGVDRIRASGLDVKTLFTIEELLAQRA